jgi:integrase
MPEARQAPLSQDLTPPPPGDSDAWIAAAFQQGWAPGTIVTCRRGRPGFVVFLGAQGLLAQSPMQLPRHQSLGPPRLPHPMAQAEGVACFRVIDTLADRPMFLLMLRGGLRVSDVSGVRWSAIDVGQGPLRVENSPGQGDRVVSLSPDGAPALRQWHGLQAAAAGDVFPSRMTRQHGLPLGARHIRNRRTRSLQRAGITKRYAPHALRQTFAPQLLNAGASLEVRNERLGPRSLQMTGLFAQRPEKGD